MKVLVKERVLQLLRNGTPESRLEFLRSLPPNDFKEQSVPLIVSNNPSHIVLALISPIQQYCEGGDPKCGATLAEAVHEYAVEIWDTLPNHGGLITPTLSNLAYYHIKALSLIGDSEEVIEKADRYIHFYEKRGERDNLSSLKVLKIAALVNLKRLDDAESDLQDSSLHVDPIVSIEAKRLQGWIDYWRTNPTDLKSTFEITPSFATREEVLGPVGEVLQQLDKYMQDSPDSTNENFRPPSSNTNLK
jgi:hypothetical protein